MPLVTRHPPLLPWLAVHSSHASARLSRYRCYVYHRTRDTGKKYYCRPVYLNFPRHWVITAAPLGVHVWDTTFAFAASFIISGYLPSLIRFMAYTLQQAVRDMQLNDYVTCMYKSIPAPSVLWPYCSSQLGLSLQLDMIIVSNACSTAFLHVQPTSTLPALTFLDEVWIKFIGMLQRHLMGWWFLQIEFVWVSGHFPRRIMYSERVAEQTLVTSVYVVCSRRYFHPSCNISIWLLFTSDSLLRPV